MEEMQTPKPISVTQMKLCDHCQSVQQDLKICNKCKQAYYCSKKCKQEHRKKHKKTNKTTRHETLVKTECDGLMANPAFSALVACVRRYNQELSALKQGEDGFGRRVGISVEVKKDMKIPAQMSAKLAGSNNPNATNAYQCLVGDLHKEDIDEKGCGRWEIAFTPSVGQSIALRVEDPEPIDNSLYNEYRQRGILDGSQPVILYAKGELVPVEDSIKPYPFPDSKKAATMACPKIEEYPDAVKEEDEEEPKEVSKEELEKFRKDYYNRILLKGEQLQGDDNFWSFCKLHFEKITRMMQAGDIDAVFLFNSMTSRGDMETLTQHRAKIMKTIVPKLLAKDDTVLDEKRQAIVQDCEKMDIATFKSLVASVSNNIKYNIPNVDMS